MTTRNVGIVFSPTLGVPANVMALMLAEYELVFCWDDPVKAKVAKEREREMLERWGSEGAKNTATPAQHQQQHQQQPLQQLPPPPVKGGWDTSDEAPSVEDIKKSERRARREAAGMSVMPQGRNAFRQKHQQQHEIEGREEDEEVVVVEDSDDQYDIDAYT